MRSRLFIRRFTALVSFAGLLLPGIILPAHEGRHVGEYDLLVGWMTEPAYEGMRNGVDFRVSRASDSEHGDGNGHGHGGDENAVAGLEDTIGAFVLC